MRRCAKKNATVVAPAHLVHDYNTGSDDEGGRVATATAVELVQAALAAAVPADASGDVPCPALRSRSLTRIAAAAPAVTATTTPGEDESDADEAAEAAASASGLASLDQAYVAAVIERVRAACSRLGIGEPAPQLALDDTLAEATAGGLREKMERQHASLAAHLVTLSGRAGVSTAAAAAETAWVEMGSGKGKLSRFLADRLGDHSRHVLVDRTRFRFEASEASADGMVVARHWERVVADIRHLKLAAVWAVASAPSVVVFGKHLCGAATDLALRCVAHLDRDCPSPASRVVAIALCCHHKCDWATYASASISPVLCVLCSYCL